MACPLLAWLIRVVHTVGTSSPPRPLRSFLAEVLDVLPRFVMLERLGAIRASIDLFHASLSFRLT